MATRTAVVEEHDGRSERKGLLAGDHSINGRYGSVSNESPRLCLVFNDSFLGGKRAAWLTKLKASGFEVEQASPRFVAIAAPDRMVERLAAEKGSHGEHLMPATRERVLHLMLSEFDSTLGAFLQVPGPFSGTTRKVDLSGELMEAGLVSWFWLHNKETAQSIAPRFPWSSWFGLSRQPMNGLREYFGSRIAWHFLYLNFLARWMLVPALASSAYAYVMGMSYLRNGSVDNVFLPAFSVGMLAWGLIMSFFLARLKARYMGKWSEDIGISGTEDVNTDADFQSTVDPETGELEYFYPRWKHMAKRGVSIALLAVPAAVVVAAGLGALELRSHLIVMEQPPLGGIAAGVATAAIMYLVTRLMCFHWSGVLTHWENYTSTSDFYYSYAAKCFCLESLAHLFPIMFIMLLNFPILSGNLPANERSILDALAIQATSVFLVYYVCTAGAHMWAMYQWSLAATVVAERTGSQQGAPDFSDEEQACRPVYRGQLQSGVHVLILMIYSFVLAPVCPVAPVLAYMWIMHRLSWDKTALVYTFQRPHPHVSRGPGFWIDSFGAVVVLALVVQIPLVLFCTHALSYMSPSVTLEERWGLAVGLELLVIGSASYALLSGLFKGNGRKIDV